MTKTPEWVQKRISKAKEQRLTYLDLSGNWQNDEGKLTQIPTEVFGWTWLQELILSGNQLTSIANSFDQLTNLRHLDLSGNQLKTVPETTTKLANLQTLNLSNNQLEIVSDTISQLTNLQTLVLSGNQIKAIPETFHRLHNLQKLDLSRNRLKTIPNAIARLYNLQRLDLSGNLLGVIPDAIAQTLSLYALDLQGNHLTAVPDAIAQLSNLQMIDLSRNRLTTVPRWLVEMPKLQYIFLYGNHIETPPPEVLKLKQNISLDLEALRGYFRQLTEEGEDALCEAKLLIIGEPGAGKTSLTRKLIDPAASLPDKDESTEGIDVHTWTFLIPGNSKDVSQSASAPEFRVNIWDFGGQEIYHATHQFFLTRRSFYVVVADAREQKTDFFHWLDLIEHLSDRSPVLIFNNEIQNRHWAINEQQLKSYFPDTFQKPFSFNLADDNVGLIYLRRKIQEQITQLPHVGDTLPRTWVLVRRALENDTRPTVTWQEFLQLCQDNGFSRNDDILQLSGYLHDLGVILHFQDDPLLKHTVILKPEWGTDAVYRILDNDEVKAKQGHFDHADLRRIWHGAEFAHLHDELLTLMMKFQLCYAIPDQTNNYIAPQLLGDQPPKYELTMEGEKRESLHLRFKYEAFMPKGLLTRFIVAIHPYIAINEGQLVWHTGVVLEKDDTRAEVMEFYHRREIHIRVMGKNKRDLLTIITYELDKLHRPFHRLKFDKLIPCNCLTCRNADEPYFYRLDILKTRLEYGKTVIECDKPPFETVEIRPLLDDVGATYSTEDLSALLHQLESVFNDEELKTVCFELGIEYDDLPAASRSGKMRELITYCQRYGRLNDLVESLRQHRPT